MPLAAGDTFRGEEFSQPDDRRHTADMGGTAHTIRQRRRRPGVVVALSLALLAAGCGGRPSDPGLQVATQSPPGDAEPSSGSTATPAVVDPPPVPESTTTTVTAAQAAKPNATPTTTAITAIPVTTTAPPPTTTTTGRPVVRTQPAGPTVVDLGMRPSGRGGWMVRTDGTVISLGDAPMLGDAVGQLTGKATDLIPTASGNGYWIIGSAGEVIPRGDAVSAGNMASTRLNSPIAGMVPDLTDGKGYWLVAEDGGIFAFDASFYGSGGGTALSNQVIAFAGTATGAGYWMTTSAGQVLPFGDAPFHGDTRATPINRPIVDMAPTPSGAGYYLMADDGGFYSMGQANFYGTTSSLALTSPVVSLAVTPTGKGYWIATGDGTIFPFGDAAELMP
jgi:hypothetical protein